MGSVIYFDLEDYISCVVASEIGNAPLEACKAQAIASRTLAYSYIQAGKAISDSSSSAQAFRIERLNNTTYPNAITAARATAGRVLTYNDKLLSPCSYSHSNGGHTTSSAERWGGSRPYLISQPDEWDSAASDGVKLGHGVGMSQVGAIYAAEHGKSCEEILAFYYPGSTIQGGDLMIPETLISEFEYALTSNFGYIYGTSGEVWSAAKQARLKETKASDPNYTYSIKYGSKWINHNVTDCSGLFVYAFKKHGQTIYHGSNSIWSKGCTANGALARGKRIDGKELLPGTAVFKYDPDPKKRYHHIGLYIGNGEVIEAQGAKTGVIKSKVTTWSHWGELKGIDYTNPTKKEDVHMTMVITSANGKSVNFRHQPSADAAIIQQLPVGTIVTAGEPSGGWTPVSFNGKSGYIMSQFLAAPMVPSEEIAPMPPAVEPVVTITLSESVAKSLAAAMKEAGVRI